MTSTDRLLASWRLWRAGRLLQASRLAWVAGRRRLAIVLLDRAGQVLGANRRMIG